MVLCVEDIVPLEIPEMFIECGMSVAQSFMTSFLVTRETSEPESRNNWPLYSDESEQISARVVAKMSLDDRVSRWMALLLAESVEAVETTTSCKRVVGTSTVSAMSIVVALCNRVSRCQTVEAEIEILEDWLFEEVLDEDGIVSLIPSSGRFKSRFSRNSSSSSTVGGVLMSSEATVHSCLSFGDKDASSCAPKSCSTV